MRKSPYTVLLLLQGTPEPPCILMVLHTHTHIYIYSTHYLFTYSYVSFRPPLITFLSITKKCAKVKALLLGKRKIFGVAKRSTPHPHAFVSCQLGVTGSSVEEMTVLQLSHNSYGRSSHRNLLQDHFKSTQVCVNSCLHTPIH
jgi:hypothetical protein